MKPEVRKTLNVVSFYQSSILSPLLFAMVMVETTKDVKSSNVKELLYVYDLVLLGDRTRLGLRYQKVSPVLVIAQQICL